MSTIFSFMGLGNFFRYFFDDFWSKLSVFHLSAGIDFLCFFCYTFLKICIINMPERIFAMTDKINLSGSLWKFRLYSRDDSPELPDINAAFDDTVTLPSTVSAAGKVPPSNERSDGFLTDPGRFEGYAVYERTVEVTRDDNCDIFLVLERTRTTSLFINGKFAGTQNSLCTPHRYNITEFAGVKPLRITIAADNISCPVPGGHMTS